MYATKALARVDFANAERCIPERRAPTARRSPTDAVVHWSDTPWDLNCDEATELRRRPPRTDFWTRKRLTGVTTQVLKPTARTARSTPGSSPTAGAWPTPTTSCCWTPSSTPATPATPDDHAAEDHLRLHPAAPTGSTGPATATPRSSRPGCPRVADESGGQIDVDYSPRPVTPPPCPPRRPTPRAASRSTSAARTPTTPTCTGSTSTSSHRSPRPTAPAAPRTRSPAYDYLDGAAWHYDDDDGLTKEKYKTWSQWRGYGHVRVSTGGQGGAAAMKSQDRPLLPARHGRRPQGHLRRHQARVRHPRRRARATRSPTTTSAAGFDVQDRPVLRPRRQGPDQDGRAGPGTTRPRRRSVTWGTITANLTGTAATRTWTSLDDGAGAKWRPPPVRHPRHHRRPGHAESTTCGDTTTAADDQCTRTTYADNDRLDILPCPRGWRPSPRRATPPPAVPRRRHLRRPHRLRRRRVRRRTDQGRRHRVAQPQAAQRHQRDLPGVRRHLRRLRPALTVTDLTADVTATATARHRCRPRRDGRTTTTAYTPTTGFPTTSTATTPPATSGDSADRADDDHQPRPAARPADSRRPTPTASSTYAYDALGRTAQGVAAEPATASHDPRPTSSPTPSTDGQAGRGRDQDPQERRRPGHRVHPLRRLPARRARPRRPGPSGGRMIADTFYDERGLVAKTFATYYAERRPATRPVQARRTR